MNFLVLKTFLVLSGMLVITALAGKRNHSFETKIEFWVLFIGGIALLFIIPSTVFPINLGLALVFALLIGSMIGPGIKALMMNYVVKKSFQKEGLTKEMLKNMSSDARIEKINAVKVAIDQGDAHPVISDWNKLFQLAVYTTSIITIVAGTMVYALKFDFSF